MVQFPSLLIAGLALAALPAHAADTASARGEKALAKELAGRVAGSPVRCLDLQRIQGTEIFEGTAIVYRTGRNVIYVNRTLGARLLHFDDIPVTNVFGSQVCRLDQVRLLDRSTRFQRGFAVLGEFVPYTKRKRGRTGQGDTAPAATPPRGE
ncbi:hypothetical protein [uncultured Sphingomonas sp.]|uniref:hypothetical protein n=1 Tax=uncultured Sphingomonas sp. TaxID=158754 RepID=UPI0025D1F907|nr:hypothetical protein [uncultured Sphingomonas sp.]